MVVQKSHLIAAAFVILLAGSYWFTRSDNKAAIDAERALSTKVCTLTVARDAYEANGFRVLAERVGRRNNPGDQKSAAQYSAAAVSIAQSIPAPKGLKDPMALVAVDLIESSTGKLRYALSTEAKSLQLEGCRQAFSG